MSGTTLSASFVYGSSSRTTSIVAMLPSLEVLPVGVAEATPSTPSSACTAFATSALVTAPSSLSTSTVVGASKPAGNASSISSKPSTDSTDFLKKVVVE